MLSDDHLDDLRAAHAEVAQLRDANAAMLHALQGNLKVIDRMAERAPPEMQRGFAMWREQITSAIAAAVGDRPDAAQPQNQREGETQ